MKPGKKYKNNLFSMWKKHQNLLSNTDDAPSITRYGSLVRLDTQIVALRVHCVRGAKHCAKCAPRGTTAACKSKDAKRLLLKELFEQCSLQKQEWTHCNIFLVDGPGGGGGGQRAGGGGREQEQEASTHTHTHTSLHGIQVIKR